MLQHFRLMVVIGLLWLMSCMLLVSAQDTGGLQPGLAIPQVSIALFSEPKAGATKLATVEPGELVTVLQVDGTWAQITYQDITGWARYVMGPTLFLVNVSSPTPGARVGAQMVYNTAADRLILYGGIAMGGVWLNDTWTYEVSSHTWTKLSPTQSPPSGGLGPLAYDIQSDRAIWFYGVSDSYDNTASETWAYDYNANTWTNMQPDAAPPPLTDPNMVYDAESDRIILFGGVEPLSILRQGLIFHNETWAYDYDTNTWTNMQPALSPPGMNLQAMAYDGASDRIVILGWSGVEKTVDTWVYDYNANTWQALTAPNPGPRAFSALVYAAGIDRLILFGNGDPRISNDMWSFDSNTETWTELTPQSPPAGRANHAMAYSPAADRIVLFGGNDGQKDCMDTWLYDPTANSWTQVGP